MELVPNLVNAAVIVLVGAVLNYVMRDRFRHLDALNEARLEALRSHMQAQMDALRSQMDSRFASVDAQFASLRSDLTQIAIAVGAQPRPQAG